MLPVPNYDGFQKQLDDLRKRQIEKAAEVKSFQTLYREG